MKAFARVPWCAVAGCVLTLAVGCAHSAWKPDAEQLLVALKSAGTSNRWQTAAALAQIPEPSVIQPLVEALTGADRDYRYAAAYVLDEYLDAPSTFERLAALGEAESEEDRRDTAKLFGLPVPPDGYDWARYESEMAAQAAAVQRALTAAFTNALAERKDPRRVALLFGALRIPTQYDWNQLPASHRHGTLSGQLLALLRSADPDVRAGAVVALGKIGEPAAVEPINPLLADKDSHVRQRAAVALADLGDPRAIQPLIAALKRMPIPLEVKGYRCGNQSDPEWAPASRAAWALGRLKAREAVKPLIAALKEGDGFFRAYVAQALGEIGDPTSIQPLIAIWRGDEGPWWCAGTAASRALAGFGAQAVEPLVEALKDENTSTGAAVTLEEIGEPAVQPLLKAFKGDNENVRMSAGMVLASIKSPAAVRGLLEMLKSKDKALREATIFELPDTKDPQVVPPLLAVLQNRHEDEDIRNEALIALGQIPDRRSIGPVTRILLNEPSEVMVLNAGWVLANMPGREPVETLLDCLKNNQDLTRRASAASGLAHVRDPRALRLLLAALDDPDQEVRSEAAKSLGEVGELSARAPLRKLAQDDPSEYVREAAAQALRDLER